MTQSIRVWLAVLLALSALSLPAAADEAPQNVAADTIEIPQAVRDACKDDYDKNCSVHTPGSPAARDCMAKACEKLSDGCVAAILDSSLADTAAQDVARAQQAALAPPAADAGKVKPRRVAHSGPVYRARPIARTRHETKAPHPVRTAQRKPPQRTAKAATRTTKRAYAHSARPANRSVARYIKRGTGIAKFYVAKYTRFAFAKAFH